MSLPDPIDCSDPDAVHRHSALKTVGWVNLCKVGVVGLGSHEDAQAEARIFLEGFETAASIARAKKKADPDHCFRCGRDLGKKRRAAGAGADCSAILNVWNCDGSFSGVFELPICYRCSMIPHNADYERLMPR